MHTWGAWPPPQKGDQPANPVGADAGSATLSLPPEMASLLASMANQVKGAQAAAEQQKQLDNAHQPQGGVSLLGNGARQSISPDMEALVQKVLVSFSRAQRISL